MRRLNRLLLAAPLAATLAASLTPTAQADDSRSGYLSCKTDQVVVIYTRAEGHVQMYANGTRVKSYLTPTLVNISAKTGFREASWRVRTTGWLASAWTYAGCMHRNQTTFLPRPTLASVRDS